MPQLEKKISLQQASEILPLFFPINKTTLLVLLKIYLKQQSCIFIIKTHTRASFISIHLKLFQFEENNFIRFLKKIN